MKNTRSFRKPTYVVMFFLLVALSQGASGFTIPSPPVCSCLSPSVSLTNQTSSSASFGWSTVYGATQYKVWYLRREDAYTSDPVFTTSTSFDFTNLPEGTYAFCFVSICGGTSSQAIITDDLMMG